MEKADNPGAVYHLPFTWPEEPKLTKWQTPEISPIVKLFLDNSVPYRYIETYS